MTADAKNMKLVIDCLLLRTRAPFTLPDMYKKLQQDHAQSFTTDYTGFRQWLFQQPIQQQLKERGFEVVIENNKYKVDSSLYWIRAIQSADLLGSKS